MRPARTKSGSCRITEFDPIWRAFKLTPAAWCNPLPHLVPGKGPPLTVRGSSRNQLPSMRAWLCRLRHTPMRTGHGEKTSLH